MSLLDNASDWLSTGLDFYSAKRIADQKASLERKQIDAGIETRRLDIQLQQQSANRLVTQNNTGFTDIVSRLKNVSAPATNAVSDMPSWLWPVLIGVVVLLVGVPLLRGGK